MVDISGFIGDRLESVLEQGRKLVEQGELARAASCYAQAAKLAQQYASSAVSSEIRKKRLDDAQRLFTYAQQLKEGRVPSSPAESVQKSSPDDSRELDPDQNSYIENARGLITQARVGWEDIAGLEEIKRFIKESYGLALARRPAGIKLPRTTHILLYGPPGTGKTLIAAAISKGLEATFFSCKVSDMLSKYFGESTKLINAVFELAGQMSPAVIFLDDFESIVPDRDGDSSGAERRVLTELLTCMDGFESKSSDKLVLVIAATNKPWLIDSAILSRFGKVAYVPLPDEAARKRIFELHLTSKGYKTDTDMTQFAKKTAGYSGREIEQICKELIRLMISRANPDLANVAEKGKKALQDYTLKVGTIISADLDAAVSRFTPVAGPEDLTRFERWAKKTE